MGKSTPNEPRCSRCNSPITYCRRQGMWWCQKCQAPDAPFGVPEPGVHYVELDVLDAITKRPNLRELTFDGLVPPGGALSEAMRITGDMFMVVDGIAPSNCKRAKEPLPDAYLNDLEASLRRRKLLDDGQTIHWTGVVPPGAFGQLCDCLVKKTAKLPALEDNEDKKADKRRETLLPENPDVLRLAKRIRREMAKKTGKSKAEIAREFCECDESKARTLLRQLRRFRHLLH